MSLATLKPRLTVGSLTRTPVLQTKAGTTEMERGRAWMAKRQRVAQRFNHLCAACGLVLLPGKLPDGRSKWQCDHIIPRNDGGSNDESNLQPLCTEPCHKAKSDTEAKARAGR